jgi:transcriptional regulator with GAF, ATPase, and Fis domain
MIDALPPRFTDVVRLGEGEDGGAWSAIDRDARGRKVVLKLVPRARSRQVRGAFAALGRVSSPHLPAALELLPAADGGLWLVTAWIEGAPLALAAAPVDEALAEAIAVAHALRALHAIGSHHGDVSLGNILRDGDGGVVLTDFGKLGCVGCGTPGFLAPEVLAGGGGPASDVFALGSVLVARIFGVTPWRDPSELAALPERGREGVRARLRELAQARSLPLDRRLTTLLEHLLDPDPEARVGDLGAVIVRLAALRGGSEADAVGRPSWWSPSRWPYRGVAIEGVVAALASAERPRLVVVAGPSSSGRGRAIEEIIHVLQEREPHAGAARLCSPERLAAALGAEAEPWLAAWMATLTRGVVGVADAPEWPGELVGGDEARVVRRQAAVLQTAAAAARCSLVIPGSIALGEQLAAAADPSILVLSLRPWSISEVRAALAVALDCGGDQGLIEAWAAALMAGTGGWPARVIAALSQCARAGSTRPDEGEIARFAAETTPSLDPLRARELLVARWEGRASASAVGHRGFFSSDGEPLSWAVAAARRALAAEVTPLARRSLARVRARGEAVSLALALDAEDEDATTAWVAAAGFGSLADPALPRLLRRLAGPTGLRLGIGARGALARHLLRVGDSAAALKVARSDGGAPELEVLAARALEQLGRPAEALEALAAASGDAVVVADDDAAATCRGLRWRALVDLGRAGEAYAEASVWTKQARRRGGGAAEALCWAALAGLYAGDEVRAAAWLDQAEEALGSGGPRDAGLRARISQLRGNLAHARGDVGAAELAYVGAAALFAAAGEPGGQTWLAANLAALAVETGAISRGITSGRSALRELVARGQLQALAGLVVNLVQLLLRIDAIEECRRLHRLLTEVGDGALAAARSARVEAEIARAELLRGGEQGVIAVEQRFAAAAEALAAASAPREARDAWCQASTLARHDRRALAAAGHLRRAAQTLQESPVEPAERLAIVIEELAVAAAMGDLAGESAAVTALSGLPDAVALREQGRLERAWAGDRVLLEALAAAGGAPVAKLKALARRLRETMEMMMEKVDRLDRAAVRASLTRELDPALGELIRELDPIVEEQERAPERPREALGAARLIQIYRRLAREDEVEALVAQVVDAIMELCDADRGVGVMLPWREGQARIEVVRELSASSGGASFSRSIIERVLVEGEPILSVDAATDDRFDASRSVSHLALRSVLAVPFLCRGEIVGAAYVDHRLRRGAFNDGALTAAEALAELASLALAHARTIAVQREQAAALAAQGQQLARLLEERELEVRGLREQVRQGPARASYRGMVGSSPAMQAVFKLIDRVADSDVPVVIYGESGTGKELVARAIHDAGPRRGAPFIAENCGAIPETLLESVLFGHAKGAFTGAFKATAGLFEAAQGGTLFLDEVGEMSAAMQTKLLRVLQEGEVRRVGESASRRIDVRVIAASNRNLEQMVADGRFRGDLYYRIQVVRIALPPLRERTEDLPALIEHFLGRYDRERRLTIGGPAMRRLARYAWPGNVRELENELQRLCVLVESRVAPEDLSPQIAADQGAGAPDPDDLRLRPRLDRVERDLIGRALERAEGNQTRAAELLGLSRFGLQKKLRRLAEGELGEPEGEDEGEERRPAPAVRKRR